MRRNLSIIKNSGYLTGMVIGLGLGLLVFTSETPILTILWFVAGVITAIAVNLVYRINVGLIDRWIDSRLDEYEQEQQ